MLYKTKYPAQSGAALSVPFTKSRITNHVVSKCHSSKTSVSLSETFAVCPAWEIRFIFTLCIPQIIHFFIYSAQRLLNYCEFKQDTDPA